MLYGGWRAVKIWIYYNVSDISYSGYQVCYTGTHRHILPWPLMVGKRSQSTKLANWAIHKSKSPLLPPNLNNIGMVSLLYFSKIGCSMLMNTSVHRTFFMTKAPAHRPCFIKKLKGSSQQTKVQHKRQRLTQAADTEPGMKTHRCIMYMTLRPDCAPSTNECL